MDNMQTGYITRFWKRNLSVKSNLIKGMGIVSVNTIDLTSNKVRISVTLPIEDDIVLIGVPVYEEGIPKILKLLNGVICIF